MGNFFQLLGTVTALLALARSLWIATKMWTKFQGALRRPRRSAAREAPPASGFGTAPEPLISVSIPVDEEPSTGAALRRLALGIQKVEADAWRRASELSSRLEELQTKVERQDSLTDERVAAALDSIDERNRRELVRDLWIALGGVGLTLVGQVIALA